MDLNFLSFSKQKMVKNVSKLINIFFIISKCILANESKRLLLIKDNTLNLFVSEEREREREREP